MKRLLDSVAAVVSLVSPEKVEIIASRVRSTDPLKAASALSDVVGTPIAETVINELVAAWLSNQISSNELALMLLAASHAFLAATSEQSLEVVWTGPTTPFVSSRRTEQVLLQVINAGENKLFITSFVTYQVSSIVNALEEAANRGVEICMLLESSLEQGGSLSVDGIGKMKRLVPSMHLYAWQDKGDLFAQGRVHAKVAVADGHTCFITSANLTGFAMERNIEAGVLISGGRIPRLLDLHLRSLIDSKVISEV